MTTNNWGTGDIKTDDSMLMEDSNSDHLSGSTSTSSQSSSESPPPPKRGAAQPSTSRPSASRKRPAQQSTSGDGLTSFQRLRLENEQAESDAINLLADGVEELADSNQNIVRLLIAQNAELISRLIKKSSNIPSSIPNRQPSSSTCCLCPVTSASRDNQVVMCFDSNPSANNETTNVAEVLNKHFWFELNCERDASTFVCNPCWLKVFEFHQFYQTVLAMYESHREDDNNDADDGGDIEDIWSDASDTGNEMAPDLAVPSVDILRLAVGDIDADENAEAEVLQQPALPADEESLKQQRLCAEDALIREYIPMHCDKCKEPYATFEEARGHQRRVHQTQGYMRCCGKRLFHRLAVLEHCEWHQSMRKLDHHPNDVPFGQKWIRDRNRVCNVCDRQLPTRQDYERHCTAEHGATFPKFQCDECGRWLSTEISLMSHRRIHRLDQQVCDLCGFVATTRVELTKHRFKRHRQPKHQCPRCGQMLMTPKKLREHIAQHEGRRLYTCQFCPLTFRLQTTLARHRMTKHSELARAAIMERRRRQEAEIERNEREAAASRATTLKTC